MTNETDVLTADFPRAVRGYSQNAVDAFVRQMGARLSTLETRLDEESDRSEQLAQKLDRANKELAAFTAKEAAITKAIVAMEQRRVTVEQELDQERARATAEVEETFASARAEAEKTLAAAREEAEKIVDTAHDNADKITTRAEAATAREEERLRCL